MGERVELGLPDKLEFYDFGSFIEIVRKWFGLKIVVFTCFALVWDLLLFDMFSNPQMRGNLVEFLSKLPHLAAGIGLNYYVIAGWFNRTHVQVSDGKIIIFHEPLPWYGDMELYTNELKQLYTKKKIYGGEVGPYTLYEVHVLTTHGRDIKLLRGLETSEQARYIEQKIEKYLHIEDRPVKDEDKE